MAGEPRAHTPIAPRRLPGPKGVPAWDPPKALVNNLPYRLRESAWDRTMPDGSQRTSTSPNVVNMNYQMRLRETGRGLFNDRPPTMEERQDKNKPTWWVFGFSGKIGALHHTQRQKFLLELSL
mmetsp:Transcript_48172/g.133520  ORF Transcript_48172/g.133520 Transcript_48172/m.133520 type:complete len:123 (-) Transcript_48172:151-519(-)